MDETRESVPAIINLVLKAIALAMGVFGVVMGFLGTVEVETLFTMLSLGLATLAIASLQKS